MRPSLARLLTRSVLGRQLSPAEPPQMLSFHFLSGRTFLSPALSFFLEFTLITNLCFFWNLNPRAWDGVQGED
jgi:hypothetical protein